jgi:hypothetical protein
MLETEELPASIPNLDPSLAYMNTDDLSHDCESQHRDRCALLLFGENRKRKRSGLEVRIQMIA